MDTPKGAGTLAKVSLGLGIVASTLIFGIGICALTGLNGGWLGGVLATLLFICGASSAFLGFLGLITGLGGVISEANSRLIAGIGIGLSVISLCMFLFFLGQVGG